MTEIIEFGELGRLKKLLAEKDRQIAVLEKELQAARTTINTMSGVNDLLRLQLLDLQNTVETWRNDLGLVSANIADMYSKLPTDLK